MFRRIIRHVRRFLGIKSPTITPPNAELYDYMSRKALIDALEKSQQFGSQLMLANLQNSFEMANQYFEIKMLQAKLHDAEENLAMVLDPDQWTQDYIDRHLNPTP